VWVGYFFGEKKIAIRETTRINTRKELKVFRSGPFVRLGRGIICVGSMMRSLLAVTAVRETDVPRCGLGNFFGEKKIAIR
jgi:hypothetical protein